MINEEKALLRATSLRDFFIARDAPEMADAYQSLIKSVKTAAPIPADWKDIEFAFNRLFVGPNSLPSPPFASVYIDSEPQIMSPSTIRIRQIYGMLGLTSPYEGSLPDDHLSLELDASIHFKTALNRNDSAELRGLWRYFLVDHLGLWIPQFVNRVLSTKGVPQAILFAVNQLKDWLKEEISAVPTVEQVNH